MVSFPLGEGYPVVFRFVWGLQVGVWGLLLRGWVESEDPLSYMEAQWDMMGCFVRVVHWPLRGMHGERD